MRHSLNYNPYTTSRAIIFNLLALNVCWLGTLLLSNDIGLVVGAVAGAANAGLLTSKLGVVDSTEELVHLLEGDTLGLGNEEPDKDEHGEGERAKDEVGTVTGLSDGGKHAGHGLGNDKVEKPLSGSTEGNVHGTETCSWDLRDKNPADGAPAELEECGKEEDADKCNIAERRDGLTLDRWVGADVDTDEEHAETLCDRGPEKRFASSKGIGSQEKENSAGNDLDDTVDTSSEETSGSTSDTKSGKDSWGILYNVST